MRVKRHHANGLTLLSSCLAGCLDHLLMTEMDTIKITDSSDHIATRQRCVADAPAQDFAGM
jgi:hypothetical protein